VAAPGVVGIKTTNANIAISDSNGSIQVQSVLPGTPVVNDFINTVSSGTFTSQADQRKRFLAVGQIVGNGGSIFLDIPMNAPPQQMVMEVEFLMIARITTAGSGTTLGDSETIRGTASFSLNGSGVAVPFGGVVNNCTIAASPQGGGFAGGTNEPIAIPTPSSNFSARLEYLIAVTGGTLGTADCQIWAWATFN
jgi:hypothetical protein